MQKHPIQPRLRMKLSETFEYLMQALLWHLSKTCARVWLFQELIIVTVVILFQGGINVNNQSSSFSLLFSKIILLPNIPNWLHIGPDSLMPEGFQKVPCLHCINNIRNTSFLNENFKSLVLSAFLENFAQYCIYQTNASEIKHYMKYSQMEIQRKLSEKKHYCFIHLS